MEPELEIKMEKTIITPAPEPTTLRDKVAFDAVRLTNLLNANLLVQSHGLASTIEHRIKEDIGATKGIPENHAYFKPFSHLTAIQSMIMSGRNKDAHEISIKFAEAVLKLVEKK